MCIYLFFYLFALRLLTIFFCGEGAPQLMLRTHRSLKAYCATPVMKMKIRMSSLMEHQWNEIDRGKPTTRRKTCPSANLSTTNPTWTGPGSNPGLRSGRPATNRLSHGTALLQCYFFLTRSLRGTKPKTKLSEAIV
jgi:hypothetical protein